MIDRLEKSNSANTYISFNQITIHTISTISVTIMHHALLLSPSSRVRMIDVFQNDDLLPCGIEEMSLSGT